MDGILDGYTVKTLRAMVFSTNIRRYSELTKADLIKVMLHPNNVERFGGMVSGVKCTAPKPTSDVGVVTFD